MVNICSLNERLGMTPLLSPITTRLARAARTPWLRPVNDTVAWDRLLARVHPLWSLRETRARVISRREEGADMFSLWLQPNRNWRGHVPGQHVALGVHIQGVQRHRVFSISSGGTRGEPIRLSIRRQPGQGMTDWLFDHARIGLVCTLSAATGEFTLPVPRPGKLLMIGAGSGITPLLAMLHGLAAEGHRGDIVLLQLDRSANERGFADELGALQTRLPGLCLQQHCSAERGRLQPAELDTLVPDLADRTTLLCGPQALMDAVSAHMAARGLCGNLRMETFARPRHPRSDDPGAARHVRCATSKQTFTQLPGSSLLEAAEAAGLQPRHGCRVGLCRTCLCRKHSGSVRNLLTGQRSAEPDEWIQLCISAAESDLELGL
jgi:stearoyl-CoA 9-desaturase NADPH oxidoreductase